MVTFFFTLGGLITGLGVGFIAGLIYVGDGDDDDDYSIPW